MGANEAAAGLLAIVVAVGLFFVLRSDSSETAGGEIEQATTSAVADVTEPAGDPDQATGPEPEPAAPEIATITVKGGEPVGGVQELSFTAGEDIRFIVESDVDEEVHLHGYDVSQEVSAGGSVEFDLPATIEGVFEVELEQSLVPIAEVSVNPA